MQRTTNFATLRSSPLIARSVRQLESTLRRRSIVRKVPEDLLEEARRLVSCAEELLPEAEEGRGSAAHRAWISEFGLLVDLIDAEAGDYDGTLKETWQDARWFQGNSPRDDSQWATVFQQKLPVARSVLFGTVKVAAPLPLADDYHGRWPTAEVFAGAVGSGLCLQLRAPFFSSHQESWAQVDWGCRPPAEKAVAAYERLVDYRPAGVGPESFLLSHFHVEHYSALLEVSRQPELAWRVEWVAYRAWPQAPGLPRQSVFPARIDDGWFGRARWALGPL